ncbi:MAG: Gfo/Idh/MocA family oxidoreductase [Piscinibacter sp.]|uniref:Gfo/Idh/MocA family protein n=1 Tax=Piscinibacter TaxID=1114981 RepID=UPI000FDE3956|nr:MULTISPECIES: Gfo/Idh/MocA family oxidoreductase [Piscinibacter]MCW5667525.1 Gfo/Idh/MocA family oxidoreductase [Piscinibacter sp.]
MTSKILRYGIIGCGSMGREHIENLRAMGGAEVTAVADPSADSRAQAAALLDGRVRLFEDHRELLASGLCDALVIASPNFTHIEVMRDALATDLPILCEKPLVTRVEDGVEMLERARGRQGIVWVAQEYRYMPPVAEMIRLAHQGAVGTLHQVAIREHREPFYPKVGDWNRFNANTGGTLVEKCCHYFNLMDFILKEQPLRVFASGGQRVNHLDESYGGKRPDILDSAYVIVEYPSGARASLDLCMFAENSLDNEHVVIVGAEGKLESLLPSGVLRYGRREDWGRREVWGQPSGTAKGVAVRQIRDTNIKYLGQHFGASYVEHQKFAQAVREGLPAEIPLEEGLRAVATGLAAHRSIETGLPVALRDVLPALW